LVNGAANVSKNLLCSSIEKHNTWSINKYGKQCKIAMEHTYEPWLNLKT
jgi:hypothetical protein